MNFWKQYLLWLCEIIKDLQELALRSFNNLCIRFMFKNAAVGDVFSVHRLIFILRLTFSSLIFVLNLTHVCCVITECLMKFLRELESVSGSSGISNRSLYRSRAACLDFHHRLTLVFLRSGCSGEDWPVCL